MSKQARLGMVSSLQLLIIGAGFMVGSSMTVHATEIGNRASNLVVNGIAGTRHNLTQNFTGGANLSGTMDLYRNNYGEVCVYCHTPHGANSNANSIGGSSGAPLWNRTMRDNTYELYNIVTMEVGVNQRFTDPGHASLTCLSCHDGITAIDSVINMPGSGGYNKLQEDEVNPGWLSSEWVRLGGNETASHDALNYSGCLSCHKEGSLGGTDPRLAFEIFAIGGATDSDGNFQVGSVVDLRDDHPVGVLYPTTFNAAVDFNEPTHQTASISFFDLDGDSTADKNEIRLYDSGEGYEVECASCHDPHGVPETSGDMFISSFLRVSNEASTLCQSCHDK